MYAAGVGEKLRIGSGHEALTGSFPVANELDDYFTLRSSPSAVKLSSPAISLSKQAAQTVVRDENGRYAVSIVDKSGKTIVTARKGTALDNVLAINNTVIASSDPSSSNYNPQVFFYILDDQVVSIASSSATYTIENSITGQSFLPTAGNWPAGFYRINVTAGQIQIRYSNYYLDVAYQFYDDAGRLISSVSPNGYYQLKISQSPYSAIDKTTYTYNHRGWLLSMTEPDAGTTQYMYRKDGSIRYSQNAKQAVRGTFSYTQYDQLNRPVESGEYKGSNYSFSNSVLQPTLEFGSQVQFNTDTDVNDWSRIHYDVPDPNFNNLTHVNDNSSNFVQNFVRNAVSWTENANNSTWFCYDERGRVVWTAQKPKALNRTFVIQYTYDFLGNVTQVKQSSFLAGSELNVFYHHYEYDTDKRLTKAYTSLDGVNKTLHASYQYYLHGPLKRIELAGNLQGIDFIYNIHGWLESINHPNINKDPGQDGIPGSAHANFRPDVFGLLLDYYDSEFNNLFPVSALDRSKDLKRLHHLASRHEEFLATASEKSYSADFMSADMSTQTDFFKNYSAQNSLYKELIKTFSKTEGKKN